MANVFDKLFSIFKPKEEEPQQQNVGVAKMAFRMNGSEHPESYSVASYTPKEGGLASRAIQNASALGQDWSKADTNTQQFVTEYYRTLDDPANVKLYKDVEALYGSDGADFDEVYGRGHTQIGNRLNEAEAMHGKDSAQYRAVQRFMQDYEDMGRTMSSTFVNSQKVQSSNTLDQTIENVYSGVVNRDDFWEVAKQGEERLSGIKGAFMPDMDGASKLQKALYYYTFATDGADAAKDMYNRFLGDTVNFQKAAADYCSDIMNNPTKLGRAWEADKANFAAAMAQTFGGIQQTFTNTKADPDDKTLANGYTISDSVDDYLRSFMGEVADEKSLQLGGEVFKQLNQYLGSEDWYKTAEKDASDYQKKVLGYMAYTYQSPEAAKEIWDIIKERNDEIWNLTKGSQSLATKAASYEGQMYDRYLGLSGDKLIGDRTVAQVVWDTALTTRAQYPQIAANIAGAMIGSPLVGQILGNAVMATSVYGNSYKQAVDEGKDIDASIGYAATQAASEFAVGMMLDGIAPIAGSLTGKAGTRFVESIANPFIKAVVKGGIRGLGEGLEEYIQEIAEPAIRNLWFHEGNEVPLYSEDALYSFFLGSISALAMSSFSTRAEAKLNTRYAEIGKAIKSQQSDSKLVDLILNNPVRTGTKEQLELYNEAKEKAQLIRSGKLTPTDIVAGELLAKYAQAGGDVSFLSNPATIRYTKEQITYNDMVAGAKSMLTELGADIEMAYDIAKLATGQAISEEAQAKINASTPAQDVLSQLQGDLDMSVNNALTRAARATTIDGVLNKVYTTLQNENPDKHVASPAAAYLINEGGYKLADAEKIGNVINKVLDGIEVTEDEAKLIKASSPAIRGALLTQADIELSEFDDTKTVLGKLNEAAAARHDIAEKQAAVKESVKTATKVRPIPKNAATAQGGISTNEQSGLAGNRAESARGRGEGIPGGTGQSVEGAQGIGGLSQDQHRRGLQPGAGTGAATEVDGQETVIPANKLDEKQRAIHRRLVSLGAQLVEFIFGEDSSCGWDPERGAYVIRIRADGQFTQEQYAKHEPVHLWISALSDDYRKFILNAWRKGFGADFDKAFDFVRGLYERKGYLKGLDGDKISYLIAEETLAMARAGQSYKGFNFAKYQDLANDFIESFNLEAIGTGDLSNPEVDAALKEGRINRTYYERQGFLDTDDSISIGDAMQNRSADDIEEENYGRERSSTDEDRISRRRAEQHLAHPDLGLLGGQLAFPSSSSYGIGEARSAREQVHNDIIQSKIIPAGGKIVPLENATEAAKDIVSIINRLAPDCLVSVVDKLPTPFTPAQFERGGRSGIDGGIFVNQTDVHRFALLYRIPEEKIAAVVATHELGHYFLYRAGKNGSTVLSYVKSKLRPRQLVQLTSAINSYEDLGKNDTERREELFCDLLAGIQRTEQAKKIDSSVRVLVEDCFVKETGYGEAIKAYGDLAASEDRASYSADDDPEYYNSIGLIDTDGTAVTFTDNVGGVHEEIINQLKGHPGEDVQDFIRRGGIRVKPGYGIEVNGNIAPTTEQYRLIDKIVRNFDGEEFNIDYNIDGTVVGTKTFTSADISEDNIYNELRRFHNSRKRDKALKSRLDKYTKLFGLPVTTMKQAYELAKMFTQYEGPDPDYQEIIDAFEGQRYSADDILDPESENYLGPEIDANTLANAREEDVYSNQDIWFRNGEDAELSTDEDAIEATAAQNEDSVEARFTALMDELEAHPERADEIFAQIKELQEQAFNKTKAVDEVKKPAEKKEKPAKAKATEKATAPKKKETPVQMAFKPKAEVEAKNAPITEAAAEPEPEIGKNEEAINSLLEELDENPALANDPDFLARVDEIAGDIAQREANLSSADRAFQPAAEVEAATTAEAEAVAELNREQNEANEFSNIGRQEIAEKIKENQQAEIKDDTRYTKKTGEWWKRIGAADSIEIRRRRADRNTFDVRFADRNGNTVTYEDISPAMLVNAFMSKLNSRELAKQRASEAMALAAQPSAEWSTYENAKPEEKKQVTVRKKDIPRDRDNYGRKIPVKLAERMSQSTVRDRNGALLSTYRLAPANGVHNAKLPGKVSFYTERPSTANTLRGLSGAEAYGQPGKSSEELIRGWLDQLADPKTSKEDAAKIRSQIAKEERKQREYTSGVTRLDPWRPGFEFATPQNIVNGKSLLEVYLDIRKPQTVDAKGQGLDFVQKTVQEYVNDPANKAGLFDANNDPLGPNDGFKFTNVKVVPEGSTLGGENLDLDTVYVTLRNNQAKSTYNTDPTDSPLVQYSADDEYAENYDTAFDLANGMIGAIIPKETYDGPTDLSGFPITKDMQEYFKEAKSVVEKEIYSPFGDPADITELEKGIVPLFLASDSIGYQAYDTKKSDDGNSIFMTDDPTVGQTYSRGDNIVDLMALGKMREYIADRLGYDSVDDLPLPSELFDRPNGRWELNDAQLVADMYNAAMSYPGKKPWSDYTDPATMPKIEHIKAAQRDVTPRFAKEVFKSIAEQVKTTVKQGAYSRIKDRLLLPSNRPDLKNKLDRFESNFDIFMDGAEIFDRSLSKAKRISYLHEAWLTLDEDMKEIIDDLEGTEWWYEKSDIQTLRADLHDLMNVCFGRAYNKKVPIGEAYLADEDGIYISPEHVKNILVSSAAWAVYANTTNPLVVDGTKADGSAGFWNNLSHVFDGDPELKKQFDKWYSLPENAKWPQINTRLLSSFARDMGYDSLIIKNIYDIGAYATKAYERKPSNIYVVFNPSQIKSVNNKHPSESALMNYSADDDFDTGFTEGSLEDTILKIMQDKDEDRAVAALTEYLAQFLQTGVLPEIEDQKTRNIFQPLVTPGQQKIIEDKLADLTKKYGALEEGENPARKIAFPKRTDDGYVRRVFRTAAESKHTPDRAVPTIEREIVQGEGATYQRITDKAATAYADREMRRKGYDRVKAEWQGKLDVEGNKITKNDVALGELLYIEAVKVGDMETAMSTLAELAEIGTTAGQVVQAFRMLKNMPKSYQLYYFQRVINRLNRQFSKRIESGKMQELKIGKPFAKAVLDAKTEKELNDAIDELIQHVADQIPATLADKWNAWRYFAMLGNPKTHIRNVFGNALFAPAKFMKNLIAAGLETTFIKDVNERQTSFKGLLDRKGTAEYRAFAEEDFEGIKGELQSGGKYNPTNRILEARTMFKFKPLEKLRRLSGDLLEREDGIFLKAHYVNALTNFLATRGLSVADLSGTREGAKVLNAARQYAFTEAQKATYRDASQVATALNQLKRIPVLGTLVEGLLPFTKTPINILKRGIEYSPVGLLKTVALETSKLKNGDISANEYIDNISAGLTGTGIVLLGVLLSSLGILRGGDDDDDKQADFDTLQGYQNYSINAGGYNYTIDWMAPSALPLFVGSALYNEMQSKGGISPADLLNITSAIAEPITQLSMLSGLNDALKTAKWDENPLSSVAMAMASGYASQGIPTVLAQISRSLTPDRRTTYVDKNSDVPQALQRWWQTNVMGKTPLNYQRAEYIDAWGRKDTTQSFALRLVENMLSPGYLNKIETTPVDEELQRLANATGTAVLMTPAERKIEFNNETHNLTAEQYAVYAKTRGDATMTMLTELFNSVAYADMSDEEKAKAVSYIKAYGNSLGKSAVFPEYSNDDDNWARKCDGDSTRLINMALLKAEASNAGLTAGNNGEFYSMIVHSDWLGPVEQAYAIAQQYTTTSDKAYVSKGGPTYDLTKERKDQMYEYYRMIFPEYYVELVNSQEWNAANDEKKMDLLSDLRKDVGTTAKIWLAQQLSAAGVPSDY